MIIHFNKSKKVMIERSALIFFSVCVLFIVAVVDLLFLRLYIYWEGGR